MSKKILKVKLKELKHHPLNTSIYGERDVTILKASIQSLGILKNIVVNRNMEVVSGNGRLQALLELQEEALNEKEFQYTEIEVEQIEFETDSEEKTFLIEANAHREKTVLQKINEGMLIEKITKEEAKARMLSTLNHGLKSTNKLARENFLKLEQEGADKKEKGRTYQIVAQKVGLSNYKSYAKGRPIALKIQQYRDKEELEKVNLLTRLIENSLSAAYKAVEYNLLEDESSKDWKALKEKTIKIGQVNPNLTSQDEKGDLKQQLNLKLKEFEKLIAELQSLNDKIEWGEDNSPITVDHEAVFSLFHTIDDLPKNNEGSIEENEESMTEKAHG